MKSTNLKKDSFALADTFTGGAKVEGAPGRGPSMFEERLGCYILVATRTRRGGTGGHSTGGWCWQVLTSCNCMRIIRTASRPQVTLSPGLLRGGHRTAGDMSEVSDVHPW